MSAATNVAQGINALSNAYTSQRQTAQDSIVAGVATLNCHAEHDRRAQQQDRHVEGRRPEHRGPREPARRRGGIAVAAARREGAGTAERRPADHHAIRSDAADPWDCQSVQCWPCQRGPGERRAADHAPWRPMSRRRCRVGRSAPTLRCATRRCRPIRRSSTDSRRPWRSRFAASGAHAIHRSEHRRGHHWHSAWHESAAGPRTRQVAMSALPPRYRSTPWCRPTPSLVRDGTPPVTPARRRTGTINDVLDYTFGADQPTGILWPTPSVTLDWQAT